MSGVAVFAQERLGLSGLEALADVGAEVALVVCPDADLNRRVIAPADIAAFCRSRGWPHLETPTARAERIPAEIRKRTPEALYVLGWSELIPPEILDAVSGPRVGFHGTLLPRHRGCAPIPWTIIHGLRRSGMTMFHLGREPDSGPILGQEEYAVGPHDTAADLYERSCEALARLMRENHQGVLDGNPGRPQDERLASFWPRRRPQDGIMDWSASAVYLHGWVRALTRPFPGAFTWLDGRKVTIWRSAPGGTDAPAGAIGAVLGVGPRGVDVGCGEGALRLLEVEPEGLGVLEGAPLADFFRDRHGQRFDY